MGVLPTSMIHSLHESASHQGKLSAYDSTNSAVRVNAHGALISVEQDGRSLTEHLDPHPP